MALLKRYFSFTDPINGEVTKGYGYTVSRSRKNTVVKLVDNKAVVLKNETVDSDVEVVPKYENVSEITQQEFDALDVSKESLTSKLRREGEEHGLKKLQRRLDNPHAESSIQDVVAKFKKVAGK